ncbi:MFS transporter [Sphingobium sp. TA15]|uniref:MFS transporter, putative metabolite:H+ symporter n=1 Tax=Sphingobium indicum (strain DSM 16413 / CCM 7287 / MTCC 6362 / UT26 / NBRC 101211 / UT26S) TaxID=452662 RepID=D4YXF6_SPHIU|nr:MFS transporter [Sphingobium indicum]BAI95038.1 MFS transporter, putative metabolite:H+ symporter [Sphingobium indicum UT26S]BDD67918.1 MFS transporter [Sphingobium sp. TA15]
MANSSVKVRPLLADAPLSAFQIAVVALCVLINICDGLDTTATAYAAPAILKDWRLAPQTMGLILSAGAAGLMLGAILIAPLADRFGRRPIVLAAATTSAVAMIAISASTNWETLLLFRFLAGLAIGALVPSLSVIVVEFSNETRGNFFLACVHIGFAIGAMIGAAIGAALLGAHGWRSIYLVAGLITGAVAVAAFVLLPESLHFLLNRQPANALARANAILRRLKQPELAALPPVPERPSRSPLAIGAILSGPLRSATLFLWLASFMRYFVSYFLTSWKPQVLVLAGFKGQAAVAVGMATSFAAILGVLAIGTLAARLGSRRATAGALLLCAVGLMGFAWVSSPVTLILFAMLSMFSIEAAFTGMLITSNRLYPDHARSTGVGLAVGMGRVGAIAGPYAGGVLIGLGLDKSAYYPLYAVAALIGAGAILLARARGQETADDRVARQLSGAR